MEFIAECTMVLQHFASPAHSGFLVDEDVDV